MTLVKLNNPNMRTRMVDNYNYNFLNEFLGSSSDCNVGKEPRYKVQELDDKYVLEFAVPGLTRDDLFVEVDNRVLTIKTVEVEDSEPRKGFAAQNFNKQFKLSNKVNVDAISATTTNGILHIELPKVEQEIAKPARTIEIA
jgi:HSP20 family protein